MKELKELLLAVLKLGELIEGLADGVGFEDVSKLIALGKSAGPGLKDAKQALSEYANLTDAQAIELNAYVGSSFDLADDKVEAAVETGLKVAIELHELAKLFVKEKTIPAVA